MSDIDTSIRLSKRMAELGLCSRREADEFIERGWVKVDGVVVDVLGSRVRPEQRIELVKSAETELAERVTILLHKPVGYVCGPAEPGERPAWQLIKQETRFTGDRSDIHYLKKHHNGLAPAGWLDVDASGLLILTQDGRVSRKLNGRLHMNGEALPQVKASQQSDFQLRLVVRENRNRLIRQLCDLAGIRVAAVRRIRVGRIALTDLPLGQWRYLRVDERF